MYIYLITNKINFKKYVGCTTKKNPYKRWNEHIKNLSRNSNHSNTKTIICKAMRKYGIANFTFRIIDFASSVEEMFVLEKYYISIFDSNKFGYNSTIGGEGVIGYSPSVQTREKLRKANLGKRHSEETKEKISKSNKGRVRNGKELEDLTLRCKVESAKQRIPVSIFNLNGDYICTFISMSDAARKIGCSAGNITSACSGRLKTCGGFIWKYA